MPSRFVQQISRRCQIPIGVADPGMSQVAGKNGHPSSRPTGAVLPMQQNAAGKYMTQIMEPGQRVRTVGLQSASQITENHADGGIGKSSSAIRHKEVLGVRENYSASAVISLQRCQCRWV